MHSLRRVVLRTASSAAVAVPKAQSANLAARFAAATTLTKVAAVPVARLFTTSSVRPDEDSNKPYDSQINAGDEAGGAFGEGNPDGSFQAAVPTTDPKDAKFIAEANGVFGAFIWNIPYRSTEREMFDTFSRFGKVHSLNIGRDARGLSRGFAFVYYQSLEDAQSAVSQADGAFWQGRRIGAKPKNPSDGTSSPSGGREGRANAVSNRAKSGPTSSLYIGNIPYEATDSELNNLFSGLDNILDVRVAIDKATGWPRGFAHADFADADSATKALDKLSTVSIQGRLLRLDYSEGKKNTNSPGGDGPGPRDRSLD